MKQTFTFLVLFAVIGTGAMAQSKKAQIENLQHIVDSLTGRVEMLNGQLMQRTEENNRLSKEISDATKRSTDLWLLIQETEQKISQNHREKEGHISGLNKEIDELNKENDELNKEIADYSEQLPKTTPDATTDKTGNQTPEKPVVKPGFVDLGLPSGTYWKKENEKGGFYTYNDALKKFGKKLPTENQFRELISHCQWEWTGSGYKVTGPNGNSINLPAKGYRVCKGAVTNDKTGGSYWSSTYRGKNDYGTDVSWFLGFGQNSVFMFSYQQCDGRSVRLVQD